MWCERTLFLLLLLVLPVLLRPLLVALAVVPLPFAAATPVGGVAGGSIGVVDVVAAVGVAVATTSAAAVSASLFAAAPVGALAAVAVTLGRAPIMAMASPWWRGGAATTRGAAAALSHDADSDVR